MTTIKVQQMTCPNCGGILSEMGIYNSKTKCVYCGTVFDAVYQTKDMSMPERIIPFTTTKEQFEKAVLEWAIKRDYMPYDLFDLVKFKEVQGVYLPMYLYEGGYVGSYNCMVGSQETVTEIVDKKPVLRNTIRWNPHSGNVRGNFELLGIANNGSGCKPELIDFAITSNYYRKLDQPFDSSIIKNELLIDFNVDQETVWKRHSDRMMESLIKRTIKIPGDAFKDLTTSIGHTEKTEGRKILVPFWIVYYEYKGETYYAIAEGCNLENIDGTSPICIEAKKEEEEAIAAFIKKETNSLWFFIGFVISVVIAFVIGYHILGSLMIAVGVIIFVVWANVRDNRDAEKIISDIRAKRRKELRDKYLNRM